MEANLSGRGFWRGRRVLVTGCNGFLGSWLTEKLVAEGAEVAGLIRERLPDSRLERSGLAREIVEIPGDVTEIGSVERALDGHRAETVFHLAAQALVGTAREDPVATLETNVRGTWNVLDACRRTRSVGRIVVASSDKAYGSHERLPYDEDFALRGQQPYDVSKSCADLIAVAFHHAYALPVAVTRSANLYGGGDLHFSRLVPGTIRSALEGRRPVIRSDGTPLRDYVHVGDVAEGYLRLARALDDPAVRGQAFNLGNGRPLSALEMARRILALAGRADLEPEILGQAADEIPRQYLATDKAARVLGWRAATALDAGLRATIDWYREFFARP